MRISAQAISRAAYAMSTDRVRYYLCGVHVEALPDGGAVAVATDGHILIAARDVKGDVGEPCTLRLDPGTLKALRVERNIGERFLTMSDAGELRVTQGDVVEHIQPGDARIDGTFPDWRRVLPTERPTRAGDGAAFDARLLTTLGKALNDGTTTKALKLTGDDAASPHWAVGSCVDTVGICMPLRDHAVSTGWL